MLLMLLPMPLIVAGDLLLSCSPLDNVNKSVPLFNGITWQKDGETNNALDGKVLVNLQLDRSIFDYCDALLYNREGISNLLIAHSLNYNDSFVALFDTNNAAECADSSDLFAMSWLITMSVIVKNTGALGELL